MAIESISVLLVEDHGQMRHLVRSLLRAYGFRSIYDCADPADALELMRHTHIDLIVTDLAMRPIDGLEFSRMVRLASDSPNPTVPIVLVTAHADRRRVKAARDAGVNSVLVKPLSARNLMHHVNAALSDDRPFVRTATYFGPQRRDVDFIDDLVLDDEPQRRRLGL